MTEPCEMQLERGEDMDRKQSLFNLLAARSAHVLQHISIPGTLDHSQDAHVASSRWARLLEAYHPA